MNKNPKKTAINGNKHVELLKLIFPNLITLIKMINGMF